MKKIISALLCLALLLSSVWVLSSCSRYTGEPKVSRRKVDVDISEYTIVYSGDISEAARNQIKDFTNNIKNATGKSLKTLQASATNTVDGGVIVVGLASEAAVSAVNNIDGHGWTIRVTDDQIVIAGTTTLLTNMALDYFTTHYLPSGGSTTSSSTVLSVNKKVILEDVPMVALVSDNQYHFEVVYSHLLDDIEGTQHIIPGNHDYGGKSPNGFDYPVDASDTIRTAIKGTLSASGNNLVMHDDTTETANEILVGVTNRDVATAVYRDFSAKQYGVVVRDGKIMAVAWNDEALQLAVPMLTSAIADSYYKDEDGNESILLPADYSSIKTMSSSWVTDFPKPQTPNVELVGTLSSSSDGLVYAYRGVGVTAAAFDAYCSLLAANGYTLVQKNTIDENKFATYKNTSANAVLHVEYAAYMNDINYSYDRAGQYADTYEPTIRITSSPITKSSVLPSDLIDTNSIKSYTKLTDSMITQPNAAISTGVQKNTGVIFTLEDGSFIIYDSGDNVSGAPARLWTILTNLYKKAHNGSSPTTSSPIHIRAWIISHEHGDHTGLFTAFLKAYGKSAMKMDYLLANFTSATQDYNAMQQNHSTYNSLSTLKGYCSTPFEYIKVSTGQKLYIKNATIEVLFTHDETSPMRQPFANDTSTVVKVSLYNTDGKGNINKDGAGKDSVQTFMCLGDASLIASTFMRAMYSEETLNVDHSQVAHHGGYGVESELYDVMSPTTLWWTYTVDFMNKIVDPDNRLSNSLEYQVGHHIMYELYGLEYVIAADKYSTTVILSKDGAMYNQLWNADYVYGSSNATLNVDDEAVVDVVERRAQ